MIKITLTTHNDRPSEYGFGEQESELILTEDGEYCVFDGPAILHTFSVSKEELARVLKVLLGQ